MYKKQREVILWTKNNKIIPSKRWKFILLGDKISNYLKYFSISQYQIL